MRITDEMVQAFDEASPNVITAPMAGRKDWQVDVEQIREGLRGAATLIAEQAIAGYIEQGAQLTEAKRLLTGLLDQAMFENGYTSQAREFLA